VFGVRFNQQFQTYFDVQALFTIRQVGVPRCAGGHSAPHVGHRGYAVETHATGCVSRIMSATASGGRSTHKQELHMKVTREVHTFHDSMNEITDLS
jgi:hypothetical protein